MLYYNLAESLNELELLSNLVKKVEYTEMSLPELEDEKLLLREVNRIKTKASSHILLFGGHSAIYLNTYIIKINDLVLQLFEIQNKFSPLGILNYKEGQRYQNCTQLKFALIELSFFFRELKESTT